MTDKFSKRIKQERERLKLNVTQLAILVGMSDKYVYSLERETAEKKEKSAAQPKQPPLKKATSPVKVKQPPQKKNISPDRLKQLILILSHKVILPEQWVFIAEAENKGNSPNKGSKPSTKKDQRAVSDDQSVKIKGYFENEVTHRIEDIIDPKILKELLLCAVDLHELESLFEIVEQVHRSNSVLDKFINQELERISFTEINHNFQVWTFSDVLSAGFPDKIAARRHATDIIKYKIRYVYFVPLENDTQAKLAYRRVSEEVKKLLDDKTDTKKEIHEFWKANEWTDFFRFYGITDTAFFTRFRLYDAAGEVIGNYNVGGSFTETAKLVNMAVETAVVLRNKLRHIINTVEVCTSDEEILAELGCRASKKKFSLNS